MYLRSVQQSILKDPERFKIGFRPQSAKEQQGDLTCKCRVILNISLKSHRAIVDKDFPIASTSRVASEEPPPPAQPPLKRSPPSKQPNYNYMMSLDDVLMSIGRHALDLDSSQPQIASPERKQSVPPMPSTPTPSEWPASPISPRNHHDEEMEVDFGVENEPRPSPSREFVVPDDPQPTSSSKASSHLSAPTPAQRPKPRSPSATESPVKAETSSVSRPSAPMPSSSPLLALPIHTRRRVPYPAPPAPPDPDSSGFGHILVPNSDTSGQSLSQSQARSEQLHASQTNFFPIPSDVSQAQMSASKLAGDNVTEEQSHAPVSSPIVRPSQPDSYDGDRSSPELLLQTDQDGQRQQLVTHSDTTHEAANSMSSPRRSQVKGQDEHGLSEQPDVQEGIRAGVVRIRSDDEHAVDEAAPVADEQSPNQDLSDDDAQIHAMLTQDSPSSVEPHSRPDSPKDSTRIRPVSRSSVQGDINRGHGSNTSKSRSPSVSRSLKPSRAVPSPHPLSPIAAPAFESSLKQTKDAKAGQPSSSATAVEHDAEAWRNPSFMRSVIKGKAKAGTPINPTESNKVTTRPRAALPVAPPSKPSRLLKGSDGNTSVKIATANDHASRANTPAIAGPSKPNKRNRDHSSVSSSRSLSDTRGDLESGPRKKRKVEAGESGSKTASTSSSRSMNLDHDVRMGNVDEEAVGQQLRISSDAHADSGSRNGKRPGQTSESGNKILSTSSGWSNLGSGSRKMLVGMGESSKTRLEVTT